MYCGSASSVSALTIFVEVRDNVDGLSNKYSNALRPVKAVHIGMIHSHSFLSASI